MIVNIFNIAERLVGRRFAVRVAAQIVDQYNWARRVRRIPHLFDAAEEYVDRNNLTRCTFCHCLMTERFIMGAHVACRNFMGTLPRLLIAVTWADMGVPGYLP